jgi:hypothetical protein
MSQDQYACILTHLESNGYKKVRNWISNDVLRFSYTKFIVDSTGTKYQMNFDYNPSDYSIEASSQIYSPITELIVNAMCLNINSVESITKAEQMMEIIWAASGANYVRKTL